MFSNLFDWYIGENSRHYTLNNRIAVIILSLIFAMCFDVLNPQIAPVASFEDMELNLHSKATSSGKIFNQLFWIVLMVLALWTILRDPSRFAKLILTQWPLAVMTILVLLSGLWALNSTISFRRAIQFVFVVTSLSAGIGFIRTSNQLFLILYRICTLAMLLNLYTLIMGNFDVSGYFYGIHGNKNGLGAMALLSISFGLAVRNVYPKDISKPHNTAYLLLWTIMLILSVSKTSIALLILVPALVYLVDWLSHQFKFNIGIVFLGTILLLVFSIQIILGMYDWHIKQFLAQFMSDPGFTGRDYIWLFLLEQIDKHWLLGHGYGSFWGIGDQSPNVIFGKSYLQLLNQGHNGYLDLLAALGIVGLFLYFVVLVNFSRLSGKIKESNPKIFFIMWVLLIITLMHNITESSLMRGSHAMWIIQLLVFIGVARLSIDQRKAK